MFDPELTQYAIILLAALAIGGAVYALALPFFNGERKAGKRMAGIAGEKVDSGRGATTEQKRRKAIQQTLEDLDGRSKKELKITLRHRLTQAGLKASPLTFYLFSVLVGLGLAGAVFIATGGNKYVPIGAFFVGALGLPRWVVNFLARRRQNKFLREFANAIDIIVRGVKTGLPLNDCIKIIAQESPDPVGPEFARIVDEQRIGIPLAQGIERLYQRMPLQEVNFLSIVISIQQSAGGNLAEALANLSGVLRDRKKLEGKVRAFSQEAKSSAAIIGSLPIIVMGAVYALRPDYIRILFDEKMGNVMLMGSAVWMLIGVLVMRKMINFDY